MELTKQQEDIMLEEYREEQNDQADGMFESWYSDNKFDLIREFAKEHKLLISDVEACEDEFNEFARAEFKLWEECR